MEKEEFTDLLRKVQSGGLRPAEIKAAREGTTREERIANFNAAVVEFENNDSYKILASSRNFEAKLPSRPALLDTLVPIGISDLTIGKTHRGYALFGHIITRVLVMKSAMVLIEDGDGNITDLAVYGLQNVQQLSEGRNLAIIEPFFKVREDGSKGIRVENPSDLVFDAVLPSSTDAREVEATPKPRIALEDRLQELVLEDNKIGVKKLHEKLLGEGYSVSNKRVKALRAPARAHPSNDQQATLIPILSERQPEKHRVLNAPIVLEYRQEGNKAFRAQQFQVAEDHYTTALKHRDDDGGQPNDDQAVHLWQLYGNRGAAHLKLGKLDEALRDCLASNICAPEGEVKPVLRCADALVALGLRKESTLLLDAAQTAFPDKRKDLVDKKEALAPKEIIEVGPNKKYSSIAAALHAASAGAELLVDPCVYREPLIITKAVTIRCTSVDDDYAAISALEGNQKTAWAEIMVLNFNAVFVKSPTRSPVHIIGCRIVCTGSPMMSFHAVNAVSGVIVLRNCSLTSSSGPVVVAQFPDTRLIVQACAVHDGAAGGILTVESAQLSMDQVHCCRNAAMGLELRDGGCAVANGCNFYSNGRQGITSWKLAGRLVANHCSIHSNSSESGVLVSEAEAELDACKIYGNGAAGVVSQQKGSIDLFNCQIHDNGDGVLIQDTGDGRVQRCEVFSNRSNGIFVGYDHRGSAAILENSVHDNNSAGILVGNRGQVVIRDNDECNNLGRPPELPKFTPLQTKVSSKFVKRLKKNKKL